MGWMGKGWGDQAGGLGSCEFGAMEFRQVAVCGEFFILVKGWAQDGEEGQQHQVRSS